jgi:hypothetical protein
MAHPIATFIAKYHNVEITQWDCNRIHPKLTMVTEVGKLDLNLRSVEKSLSLTKRRSLFVLVAIAVFSGGVVSQSSIRSYPLDQIEETKTKRTVQQSGSTKEAFQRVELTREEQRGSWIGNSWVPPPGWRLYSASELKNFYRDTSILWVGDSTARRAATTMYGILNASSSHVSVDAIDHPSVIDVNKRSKTEECNRWTNHTHHPELCRAMPGGSGRGGSFILKAEACLVGLELFVRDELSGKSNITADVDIVVISLGIWEAMRKRDCREKGENPRSMLQIQNDTISLLEKLQSPRRTIVWRTSGHMKSGKKDENFVTDMNGNAMDKVEEITSGPSRSTNSTSNLTYVDWGGAVYPRSFEGARIEGDMKPHYGLEARYVLVQMITNQLASRLPGVQLQRST